MIIFVIFSATGKGSTHHIANGQLSNGNGVLTIQANGNHVNGDHVFFEKSPIVNGTVNFVEKRNNSTGVNPLQQSPPQNVAAATNSRRRTISSNSNGYGDHLIFLLFTIRNGFSLNLNHMGMLSFHTSCQSVNAFVSYLFQLFLLLCFD